MLGCFSFLRRLFNKEASEAAGDDYDAAESFTEPCLISSAIASGRLYRASPGRSNSIIDSAAVSISDITAGIAVTILSADPRGDFRRSMEEMATALGSVTHLDLAVLRQLLLCYLTLNTKQEHKYIAFAFADLLYDLYAGVIGGSGGDGAGDGEHAGAVRAKA